MISLSSSIQLVGVLVFFVCFINRQTHVKTKAVRALPLISIIAIFLSPSSKGKTPLAVSINQRECVVILLEAGANVHELPKSEAVPQWVIDYQRQLANCQCACVALSRILRRHGAKDLVQLIVPFVWETRRNSLWRIDEEEEESAPLCPIL